MAIQSIASFAPNNAVSQVATAKLSLTADQPLPVNQAQTNAVQAVSPQLIERVARAFQESNPSSTSYANVLTQINANAQQTSRFSEQNSQILANFLNPSEA